MKYIHVSKTFEVITKPDGTQFIRWNPGVTMNIGRNKEKRRLRTGKPRKHWRVIDRNFGYSTN